MLIKPINTRYRFLRQAIYNANFSIMIIETDDTTTNDFLILIFPFFILSLKPLNKSPLSSMKVMRVLFLKLHRN